MDSNCNTANAPFFVDLEVIVLNRNGLWLSDGVEITHEPTRQLFARCLKRDPQGYYLQVGRETKRIQVEDTAYFVERLQGSPAEGYRAQINDTRWERMDPATLSYRPGRLTITIEREGAREEARFLSVPYFDLLRHLEDDDRFYYLNVEKTRVDLAAK